MRHHACGLAIAVLVVAAGVLLLEVRLAWNTHNSFAVIEIGHSLQEMRRIEELLRNGEVDSAIAQLERSQGVMESKLSQISDELERRSWRWADQRQNVKLVEELLGRE